MINYLEKGPGLHRAITEAGYSLQNRDGVWMSSDDTAVQAIIDSFNPDGPDGKPERDASKAEIDRMAGETRQRFITDIPGQQGVYLTKAVEAKALLADSTSPAPHIRAEATINGLDVIAIATRIVQTETFWLNVLSPTIEAIRQTSKERIDTESWQNHASIVDSARAAFAAIG